MNPRILAIILALATAGMGLAAPEAKEQNRVFEIRTPDHTLSPYSGMTRQHWIECGRFMLEGAFQHVKDIDDPMLFPKVPGISSCAISR
jgi:hypothetical protein